MDFSHPAEAGASNPGFVTSFCAANRLAIRRTFCGGYNTPKARIGAVIDFDRLIERRQAGGGEDRVGGDLLAHEDPRLAVADVGGGDDGWSVTDDCAPAAEAADGPWAEVWAALD